MKPFCSNPSPAPARRTQACPPPQVRPARLLALCLVAFSAVGLSQGVALADSVKLGGQWIDNVSVQSIDAGQILYTVGAGGEVTKSISDLQGLKLSAYPDLGKAMLSLEAHKPAEAVAPLKSLIATARQPWVKQYTEATLLRAFDEAGSPLEAVNLYLRMAGIGETAVDKSYLKAPPIKSVGGATAAQKKELRSRLNEAAPNLTGPAEAGVKAMLELVPEVKAEATEAAPVPGGVTALGPSASAETSAVLMSKQVPADDQAVQFLRKGKFTDALKLLDDQLSKPSNELSLRMYLRGVALYEIAKQNNDRKTFLDAGLSFARVWCYFPRSSFASGANIGTAMVMIKVNDIKNAKKQLDKARVKVDAETEPELSQLMTQADADLAAADTGAGENK